MTSFVLSGPLLYAYVCMLIRYNSLFKTFLQSVKHEIILSNMPSTFPAKSTPPVFFSLSLKEGRIGQHNGLAISDDHSSSACRIKAHLHLSESTSVDNLNFESKASPKFSLRNLCPYSKCFSISSNLPTIWPHSRPNRPGPQEPRSY